MCRTFLIAACSLLVLGCSDTAKHTHDTQPQTTSSSEVQPFLQADLTNAKPDPLSASLISEIHLESTQVLTRLSSDANELAIAIEELSKKPTKDSLEQTHSKWTQTHNTYISSRLFRQWLNSLQVIHPLLDVSHTSPELIHTNHSRIDQYPLIPGYLDKVKGYPSSGLIHSELELSPDALNQEHLLGDANYVALGFHALQFMLFGEANLPRTADDFVIAGSSEAESQGAMRRQQYIKLLSELLKQDIEALSNAWKTLESYYPLALSSIQEKKLSESLLQIAEVELEACKQIQAAISKHPEQLTHDTADSLSMREKLAKRIIAILMRTKQTSKKPVAP